MGWIDWGIAVVPFLLICCTAYAAKKYMKSVADFLAANRCAGKYLLGVSDGIATLGAVSIIAMFEMYYKAGFTAIWWYFMQLPICRCLHDERLQLPEIFVRLFPLRFLFVHCLPHRRTSVSLRGAEHERETQMLGKHRGPTLVCLDR